MASTTSRGPKQIFQAAGYSWQGLQAAWRHEASFRLELYSSFILLPGAMLIGRTSLERACLAASVVLVPTMELLNSGLEAIVDKTTPEHHALAGQAKDMGSAAVSGAMVIFLIFWASVLIDRSF